MIPVTKPFSPPLEKYNELVKGIWQRNWFTNNGPLVNDLELKLKAYLNLNHLLFVSKWNNCNSNCIKSFKYH